MERIPVSVIVMTKNEESNIAKCLAGLTDFAEVFVVDSRSTDNTCAIAESYGAKVVQFDWNGRYPKKKQWCLKELPCTYPILLYVDADEEMSPELAAEIRACLPKFSQGYGGAFVGFDYVFAGKKLAYGHRVYKLGLVHQGLCEFLDYDDLDAANMWEVEGHYQPAIKGRTFALKHRMLHDDHDSLYHYFDKHNRYSDWEAQLRSKGLMNDPREANLGLRSMMKKVLDNLPFKPLISFLHSYILKFGFLDGAAGFHYAMARATYYWQIGLKMDELAARKQTKLVRPGVVTARPAAKESAT